MSDFGRKDFSTQAKEEITPNSSKSPTQKLTEGVTGTVDSLLGALNPDSNKSTTQGTFDKTRREKDAQTNSGPLGSVTGALGLGK